MLSRIATVLLACMIIATGGSAALAADTATVKRVMVLPFDGGAAGNFAYLTDSVRTMVASRLTVKPGVEVVEYTLSPQDMAALQQNAATGTEGESVFSRLQADYLLSGTLYSLQTGLKIQVTMSRKTPGPGQEGVFTVLAENEERIIGAVEELVDDIAGRGLRSGAAEATVAAGATGSDGVSGFGTEHPEKAFKKGFYGGAITAEGGMQVESLGVRKSSDLPLTLVSMATGDLDGDGQQEIAAASRTALEIYRFDDAVFKKLAEYKFDNSFKIHAVNLADLDNNGALEIYVSANNNIPASSAVFTWTAAAGLNAQITNIPYYIRPIRTPADGWILAGQKGSTDYATGFIGKNAVQLKIAPDRHGVVEEKVLPLPGNIRLFDFVYAELDGKGGQELVAIDRHEKLLVYDASNSLLWVSENDYGGSRNFIGPAKSAVSSMADMIYRDDARKLEQPVVFVPTRLVAEDLDRDGKDEIIVGNNKRVTPKLLFNFREYDGGSVICLSWQETAMVELWKTNTVVGYLADYYYVMSDKAAATGAKTALYIAQVPDKQVLGFALAGDSKMLKYEMNVTGSAN